MKKYVLIDKSGSPLYTNEDPASIADKLRFMEEHDIAIDDMTVMTIDTESIPRRRKRPKSF